MVSNSSSLIAEAASACLTCFRQTIDPLEIGTHDDVENIRVRLKDGLLRFTLWSSSVGVFADVQDSLDFKLRELPDIVDLAVERLKVIKYRTHQIREITVPSRPTESYAQASDTVSLPDDYHLENEGSEKDSQDDEEDFEWESWHSVELLDAIHESIDWLLRLSRLVRRASALGQKRHAMNYQWKDIYGNDCVITTNYTLDYLRNRYRRYISTALNDPSTTAQHGAPDDIKTKEVDPLREKLVETMILRHKRILYRRSRDQHYALQKTTPPSTKLAASTKPLDPPTVAEATIPIRFLNPLAKPDQGRTKKGPSSSLDVSLFRKRQAGLSAGSTSSSMGTAGTAPWRPEHGVIPDPPRKALEESSFICSYCCLVLNSEEGKVPRKWSKHVQRDLDPYICVFEACFNRLELYTSSEEWISHMRSQHRMGWHCFAGHHDPPGPWHCDNPLEFENHLKGCRPELFDKDHLSVIAKGSKGPIEPLLERCPFCSVTNEAVTTTMETHVADHLRLFAIYSLPRVEDDLDKESGSNSSIRASAPSNKSSHSGARSSVTNDAEDVLDTDSRSLEDFAEQDPPPDIDSTDSSYDYLDVEAIRDRRQAIDPTYQYNDQRLKSLALSQCQTALELLPFVLTLVQTASEKWEREADEHDSLSHDFAQSLRKIAFELSELFAELRTTDLAAGGNTNVVGYGADLLDAIEASIGEDVLEHVPGKAYRENYPRCRTLCYLDNMASTHQFISDALSFSNTQARDGLLQIMNGIFDRMVVRSPAPWYPQYNMGLSLEDQISMRLTENHFPLGWKQRYMPSRSLDRLVTRSSIIREFSKDYDSDEHHGNQFRINESLINFIVNSGQKLFAISLISGFESFRLHKAMEVFWKSNYTDNELPVTPEDVRFPWYQLKWGAMKMENFTKNQWMFLVRIFDHSGSKMHVGNQEILPFRLVDEQWREGTFSDVWRVEIHEEQQKQPMQMFDGSGRLATAAIKALKSSADHHGSEAAGFWEREAKALEDINGLRHKHIVEMKAIITWEGKGNYFMFQWADRGSLRDFYERSPRPTLNATFVKQVLWQLLGLSSALNKLHNYKKHDKDNGSYRHGDLKPENILIFNNGTEVGLLKISDLGLAKHHIYETGLRGPTVTRHGTPLYEPPEVILEPEIARSRQYDIWSMGCVLLELLVWLMYGYDELVRFNHSMNSALGNSSVYWVMEETDGRSRSASVHPGVMTCMDIMSKDLERAGQTAISDLLWLIRNRLLVVRLPRMTKASSFGQSSGSLPAPADCRAKAADLESHMQGILNRAQRDNKYASTNVQAYNLVSRIEAVKYGIIMPSRFSMNIPVVRRQEK